MDKLKKIGFIVLSLFTIGNADFDTPILDGVTGASRPSRLDWTGGGKSKKWNDDAVQMYLSHSNTHSDNHTESLADKTLNSGIKITKTIKRLLTLQFNLDMDRVEESLDTSGIDGITSASRPVRLAWENSNIRQKNRGSLKSGLSVHLTPNITFGVNGFISKEIDYESQSASFNYFQIAMSRHLMISLTGLYTKDRVGKLLNEGLANNSKRIYKGGLNLLIKPHKYFYITTDFTYEYNKGYLQNPYRVTDRHPSERTMYTGQCQFSFVIPQAKVTLHSGYNFYHDDWNITGHSGDISLVKKAFKYFLLKGGYRYYTQNKASFYTDTEEITRAEPYTTDPQLSNLTSHSANIGVVWFMSQLSHKNKKLSLFSKFTVAATHTFFGNSQKRLTNSSRLIFSYKL